ncbi:MAG TPA: hypothetical protein VIF15_03200 [Polyangiaceae bacterium]|jgi:hypothetical protein
MRKVTVVAGLTVLSVAAAMLVLAVAERDAGAQRGAPKTLHVVGTNGSNQKVDTTAGALTNVVVKGRVGGGYTLTVEAIAGYCVSSFPNASDAAQMAGLVLDPKTTMVTCMGPVTTVQNNFIPVNKIDVATDVWVASAP